MTARKSRLLPESSQRTQAETAELSLIRMGWFVILVSFPVAALETQHFGSPMFALLMVVLYIGYLAVWWSTVQTRRFEALALAAIAMALAAVYIGAELPLWGTGPDVGANVRQWQP